MMPAFSTQTSVPSATGCDAVPHRSVVVAGNHAGDIAASLTRLHQHRDEVPVAGFGLQLEAVI